MLAVSDKALFIPRRSSKQNKSHSRKGKYSNAQIDVTTVETRGDGIDDVTTVVQTVRGGDSISRDHSSTPSPVTKSPIKTGNRGRKESPNSHKHEIKNQKSVKIILFWNSFFSKPDYGFGYGQEAFRRRHCKVRDCSTTNQRRLFREADAVVFHTRHPALLKQPQLFPKRAFPSQIYVFLNFEAPIRTPDLLRNYTDVFNLTLSYRTDSDIPAILVSVEKRGESQPYQEISAQKLQMKARPVVWLISHCEKGGSKRWEYAMELRKYVAIDIYGTCGNLTCPKKKEDPGENVKCFTEIDRTHRFFLAFENAFCKDYITEKVVTAMNSNMVPVVLGNVPYSDLLPPHSFIDVRDFRGPRHLGKYLDYLMHNDKEYLKYFDYKKQYRVVRKTGGRGFCRLCEILHDPLYRYKSNFDVHTWWREDGECLEEGEVRGIIGLT